MKLHEAIAAVLADRSAGMSSRELAEEIERRGLYLKGDGEPALPGRANARAGNKAYRDRYRKRRPGPHLPRIVPSGGRVSFATYIRSLSWGTNARATKARHAEARRPVGG